MLGRRPLLIAGGLVFALLPFTYVGVASLGMLIALRFVHGAATAIFGPVASVIERSSSLQTSMSYAER